MPWNYETILVLKIFKWHMQKKKMQWDSNFVEIYI